MREGVPVIYEVAADSADAWAATSSFSLRDKKLTEASADTVQTLTVKTGGKTVTFTVSRTRDDEKSTELIAAYQYSVKAKGEPVPVEGYQNAMAGLAALSLTGETDKGYDAQPSIIIIYTTFENGEHTMKFYPLEKESYACLLYTSTPNGWRAFSTAFQSSMSWRRISAAGRCGIWRWNTWRIAAVISIPQAHSPFWGAGAAAS